MLLLGLIFVSVTSIEIYLLLLVGRGLGPALTLGLILFTGFLGAFLAKQQGLRILREIAVRLQRGEMPARELLHGVLILIAGALLITPGLLTDLCGFLLLLPPARAFLLKLLDRRLQLWIARHAVVFTHDFNAPKPPYIHEDDIYDPGEADFKS